MLLKMTFRFFQVKGNALLHLKEAGESSTLRREEGRNHHYQLWVVLLFSLSFWMVLPFFPSLLWGCFSPLLWWVVLLGLLLLWVVVLSLLRALGWCTPSENQHHPKEWEEGTTKRKRRSKLLHPKGGGGKPYH